MLGENSKEAFDSQETQPGLVHIVVIALSFTLGLFSLVKYLYCHNDNEIKETTFFYVFGYGSLIWRPGDLLNEYPSFRCHSIGWNRLFAQVHR